MQPGRLLPFIISFFFPVFIYAAAPTTPSSNISFGSAEGNSISLNWTQGNGSSRIVIVKAGSAVTTVPQNGTYYFASSAFGSGNQPAPGEFVVYNASSNGVTVTGLSPATTYYFAVFEYNGAGASIEYLISAYLSGSKATVSAPTTPSSAISVSETTGNTAKLSWTKGNGAYRLMLIKKDGEVDANPVDLTNYYAHSAFGSGNQIGTGNYAVYKDVGTNLTISNLKANATYHVKIFEYNGYGAPVYGTAGAATASFTTQARPSIAPSNFKVSGGDGNALDISWTNGNGRGRVIIMKQGSPVTAVPADGVTYTANTTFGSGTQIAPGEYVMLDNTYATSTRIYGLSHSSTYYFSIFEYDLSDAGPMYLTSSFVTTSGATLSPPTVPASDLTLTNITNNSMKLTWVNGNGSNRIVVAKAGSPVTAAPSDFKTYYSNTSFGSGNSIGDNTFVLYYGTANNITVTNLAASTTYYYAVYEYNGASGAVYLTTSPANANATTLSRPTVAASALTFPNVDGNSMKLTWTNGNGSSRIVIAKKNAAVTAGPADGSIYSANTSFGSGTEMAPGEFVVYNGSGNTVDVTNLDHSSTYYYAVYEYAGSGATLQYLTSVYLSGSKAMPVPPATAASNLVYSNITNNSMTLTWTNGNGSKRIVIGKAGSPVDVDAVNGTNYPSHTSFGASGSMGGGNYVLYNGSANSVTITSLQPGITYYFKIVEANGSYWPLYLASPVLTGSQSTIGRPTTGASGFTKGSAEGNQLSVSWTNGSGAKRLVVASEGTAVTALPLDGVTYTANRAFGSGDQLATGQYVVMNGVASSVNVTNLQPGKTYYFSVFEYDQPTGGPFYLTSSVLSGNATTVTAPLVQTSNVSFASVASTSATVTWTNGSGFNRLLVVRAGSPVSFVPADFTKYSSNTSFGSVALGVGNYSLYAGNAGSVAITGLTSGTTYYFAAFEYNGSTAPVYNSSVTATGSLTTLGAPVTQATGVTPATYSGGTLQLVWANGSGQKRLVLAKADAAVDALPLDNTLYSANSFFGAGQQLGSGNYVVYAGSGSSVTISGLNATKAYHFAVFEYNEFSATSVNYLTVSPATAIQAPVSTLPVSWTEFYATSMANEVRLQWKTASENDNQWFEVERSADARSFQKIGQLAGSKTTSEATSYQFADKKPLVGKAYYRIRQVDGSGQSSYSRLVSVTSVQKTVVQLLQNPVRQELRLNFSGKEATITIIDLGGRVLTKRNLQQGVNTISTNLLPAGTYHAIIVGAGMEKPIALPFIRSNQLE